MPELPEVQTMVNDLNKKIIGRRIAGFWSDTPRIFPRNKISNLKNQIRGWRIISIHRRGKNILFHLTKNSHLNLNRNLRGHNQKLLVIHPKLTGRLLVTNAKDQRLKAKSEYLHAIFYLDNGSVLAFSDVRKFGKIIFGDKEKIEALPDIKNLGPDPLDKSFTVEQFIERIRYSHGRIRIAGSASWRRKRAVRMQKIKQVLLDQEVIAGIGNIYSDEALWLAKIHPFTPSNQLTNRQLTDLFKAIKSVLNKSLKVRGTSMRDYRDTDGQEGGYMKKRLVYARAGLPCRRCKTLIARLKMGVRSAHFCPQCQKI